LSFTTRPTLRGYGGAVSAGHYLAAEAGARMLADGGNAADAACAMGFALAVLEPHQNGLGGEVPILVRSARDDRVQVISGQGPAPAAASCQRIGELGVSLIPPDGFLAAAVPAALDAWCRLLEHFGTRRLADVLAPARRLAESGFAMYPFLRGIERSGLAAAARGRRPADPARARWLPRVPRRGREPARWLARGGHPRRPRPLLPGCPGRGPGALLDHAGSRRQR
jgi:gamma-glutamyltranspeptidase/glutathione hydrolase